MFRAIPTSDEYATYADAHWRELIERYQPAVLWNDIGYPRGAVARLSPHSSSPASAASATRCASSAPGPSATAARKRSSWSRAMRK